MDTKDATTAFDALSQETRLSIFRHLIKAGPDGLAAGRVAEAVEGRQNTVSSHLAILMRAGLIDSQRQGRSIIYRADYAAASALIAFLLEDCCNGRPEICAPLVNTLACLDTSREEACRE